MKKMFLMAALLTFLVPAAAGAADPYGYDINGIKFGMSGAEAKALIEK